MTFHHHEVVGARMARKRLKALRYSNEIIDEVAQLVFLHLRFYGYRSSDWTDSAVRRYVVDAGPLLPRLHKLVRSDCTTRNKRKAAALSAAYDALEERIATLREQEELDSIRPDLDGNEIMTILGIPAGRVVGRGVPVPAGVADGARSARPRAGGRGAEEVVGAAELSRAARPA